MSYTFDITMSEPLKMGKNEPYYHKWDIVKSWGAGRGIVIRIKQPSCPGLLNIVTYTVYPYKKFKKRWKQWLWFKWLKLRVAIGDLYIS